MRFVAVGVLVLFSPHLMSAEPEPEPSSGVTTGAGEGGFWGQAGSKAEARGSGFDAEPANGNANAQPGLAAGSAACPGAEGVSGAAIPLTFCQQYREPTTPVLTVGLIRTAFAELELPAGELVIQPPDGLTLVNFDTNFYTTSTEPIARTVTLLGRRVTLEATPSTFHWTFGDGESLTTSDPGAPYPRLRVTHDYLRKDTYRPSLATTYTGRYRVGGGPWRQIPGTVTIDGVGQELRAIEAEPKLVSY